jgi:uncharacterized protein (TIGR04255 family)
MVQPHHIHRTLPALNLTNPPLLLAVAQIIVSPVLKIADYIPEIQEQLRKLGFPLVHMRTTRIEASSGGQVIGESFEDWEFVSSDGTYSLLVGKVGACLVSADYLGYEGFIEKLMLCLNTLHGTIRYSNIERVSLRYVDLLQLTEDKPLHHFVASGVAGLQSPGTSARRTATRSETVFQTQSHRHLVVGVMERASGIVLPADLLGLAVKLRWPIRSDRPFALLDNLHIEECEAGSLFNSESVRARLNELHDALDHSFRAAITTQAIEEWR